MNIVRTYFGSQHLLIVGPVSTQPTGTAQINLKNVPPMASSLMGVGAAA